jgi:hypothetical protein
MTTKGREKISADLESSEFYKCFDEHLTKFKNNQILLNKISDRFLLFTGCKILIASSGVYYKLFTTIMIVMTVQSYGQCYKTINYDHN